MFLMKCSQVKHRLGSEPRVIALISLNCLESKITKLISISSLKEIKFLL